MRKKDSITEKEYTVRFSFESMNDAKLFKLPKKYKSKFELNDGMDRFDGLYHRIAQVKLLSKQ